MLPAPALHFLAPSVASALEHRSHVSLPNSDQPDCPPLRTCSEAALQWRVGPHGTAAPAPQPEPFPTLCSSLFPREAGRHFTAVFSLCPGVVWNTVAITQISSSHVYGSPAPGRVLSWEAGCLPSDKDGKDSQPFAGGAYNQVWEASVKTATIQK